MNHLKRSYSAKTFSKCEGLILSLAYLSILFFLQACGSASSDRDFRQEVSQVANADNNQTYEQETQTHEQETQTHEQETQTYEQRDALVQALRQGKHIEIDFNRAYHLRRLGNASASFSSCQPPPLRTELRPLEPGKVYVVTFNNETSEITTAGFHVDLCQDWVETSANFNLLAASQLLIWGRVLELTQEGSVVVVRDLELNEIVGEATVIASPTIDLYRQRLAQEGRFLLTLNDQLFQGQLGNLVLQQALNYSDIWGITFQNGSSYRLKFRRPMFPFGGNFFEVARLDPTSNNFVEFHVTPRVLQTHPNQGINLVANPWEGAEFNAWRDMRFKMLQASHGRVLFQFLGSGYFSTAEHPACQMDTAFWFEVVNCEIAWGLLKTFFLEKRILGTVEFYD